jgi:hypothetical protein
MYLQKVIGKTNYKKLIFLFASWKSLTKIAGSGSVTKCHVYGTLVYRNKKICRLAVNVPYSDPLSVDIFVSVSQNNAFGSYLLAANN